MAKGNEEKIRARAYEIWEREGRPEGREEDHWHEAARELGEPAGDGPVHENLVSGVDDEEPIAAKGRAGRPKAAAAMAAPAAATGGPAATGKASGSRAPKEKPAR